MKTCIFTGLFVMLLGTCINSTDRVPVYVSFVGLFIFSIGLLLWIDKRRIETQKKNHQPAIKSNTGR